MRHKRIFRLGALAWLLVATLFSVPALAQNMDETLAAEYFRNGEFDKAAALYSKLLERQPSNVVFYTNYMQSVLELKQYDAAEKEIRRQAKRDRDNPIYQVDLGYVLSLQGKQKEADREFGNVVATYAHDRTKLAQASAAFSKYGLDKHSIELYEKARQVQHNPYLYANELGQLYRRTKNYEKMTEQYFLQLSSNPYDYENVKNNLQEAVEDDQVYQAVKRRILKELQQEPNNTLLTDLLSWLFIQRKDFDAAFVQLKALDRRLREGGRRLVPLGEIAAKNHEWEAAEKIFNSVKELGRDAPYYAQAERGLLDIQYERIVLSANPTQQDIASLDQNYQAFLSTYGLGYQSAGQVVLRLAEVYAIYKNDVKGAIEMLERYVKANYGGKTMQGKARLALGDYWLLAGDEWEATLYYGQVEKMFKDEVLGHEAKFRNARLSFYRGEFEWATAQLEVLKGSTSELIANDALQLSMVIQDNLGLDSTPTPLKLFAEADFLRYKGRYAEATAKLDTIRRHFPGHSLEDDILMMLGDMAVSQRKYLQADSLYKLIYTIHGHDILGDDALYKAASLAEKHDSVEKAMELYQKLVLEYPGSVFAVHAANRYRALRGDNLNAP